MLKNERAAALYQFAAIGSVFGLAFDVVMCLPIEMMVAMAILLSISLIGYFVSIE